jgi:Ca-activated chloride channel family protein
MIKHTTTVLAILFTSLQAHAIPWNDLWLTPDQQGQRLMKQGNYTKAKDQFRNPQWSAAAAYKAGEYEQAGRLFKTLETEQGYYNQGNALAHQGQYEEAIKAYDKALTLNPKNQDAIDNRELLKQLLKKDKEKQQNKDQDKNQKSKDQKNKDQQNKDQQNKDQQNKDQQNKDQQNKDQQNKDQQNKDQQNKDQQNKAKPNQNSDDKPKDAKQSAADKEKQQAKEQWLQLIPDDPGGLLREKFLRDHLRRERGWYQ